MSRGFAILQLALIALVLMACGGQAAAPAQAPSPTTAAPTAAAPVSQPAAAAPTSAPAATFPLTIKHIKGEATLERPAVRVVALEWTYVEDVLALGVQPVGVADVDGYNTWVKIPVALDAAAQDVGMRGEPNLEKIVALKPDLIIDTAFRADANYDELNKIAPTLIFDPYPADASVTQYYEMRETFLKIAAALGRDAQGQEVLAHMDQKFAETRAALAQAGKGSEKFVLSQAYSGGGAAEVRLFTNNAMATEIVAQLGLENAWKDAAFQEYGFSTVSVETLPQLGADVNFFYVVNKDDDVFATSAVKPLWENLAFVKAGRAHPLGGDTWLFGGPLSAEVLTDIVARALMD